MSFMFTPLDYDDNSAINYLELEKDITNSLINSNDKIVEKLKYDGKSIHIDGYVGVNFKNLVSLLSEELTGYKFYDMSNYTKSQDEIISMTKENLPDKSQEDPVKLFGKIYDGSLIDLYDIGKLKSLKKELESVDKYVLYGYGSSFDMFFEDGSKKTLVYMDISPKNSAVKANKNEYKNIGFHDSLELDDLMRRNYYVDFMVVIENRKKLLLNHKIDYYIDANNDCNYKMLPLDSLERIFEIQSKAPFRCKPVYLEGIWGGEYIRKIRQIPEDISKNIAWVFEFIPIEASIVIAVGEDTIDVPFITFLSYSGKDIMGKLPYEVFDGYFPIRYNYDDTFHSDGNMSIQVHPGSDIMKEKYNERFSQDEAYYVVATGHDACTYLGFKDDADTEEFMNLAKESEEKEIGIDYRKYINSEESKPGKQFMIPSGTIHSSGRNQLVLELGSLTIGAYTYKIYDYNRKKKDGSKRPIHLKMAQKALDFERTSTWVKNNIAKKPIVLKEKEDYKEYLVGDTDYMYYQTQRIDIVTGGKYVGLNEGKFTTIAVVDGEKATVYDKNHPDRKYDLRYLEIATIPSTIEEYVIENKGYQPVIIHKSKLKEDFENYIK